MDSDRATLLTEYYEPGQRLLILASQTEAGAIGTIYELISDGVDWDEAVSSADAHGTVPLLYRTLRDHCSERTPADVLGTLHSRAELIAKTNLRYTHEMLAIVEAARATGIRVVPYWGSVLAEAGCMSRLDCGSSAISIY